MEGGPGYYAVVALRLQSIRYVWGGRGEAHKKVLPRAENALRKYQENREKKRAGNKEKTRKT